MTFHKSHIYGASYFHEQVWHATLIDSEAWKLFGKYYNDVFHKIMNNI